MQVVGFIEYTDDHTIFSIDFLLEFSCFKVLYIWNLSGNCKIIAVLAENFIT